MNITKIKFGHSEDPLGEYVGWAPKRIGIISYNSYVTPVLIQNLDPFTGGQVVFSNNVDGPFTDELHLTEPGGPSGVQFFIAGKFDHATGKGYASTNGKDATIAVFNDNSGALLTQKALMVRVRKNANLLTAGERDRFLSALVKLNQQGKFVDFQNMHTNDTSREIHGRSSFLPWHRTYILDLERQLQNIDPSVTLPYWRFDQAAPNLFTKDFIGWPDETDMVEFTNTNPLINWKLQINGIGNGRIRRGHGLKFNGQPFDPRLEKAVQVRKNEKQTLALGNVFSDFKRMENDPHGSAHVSFNGQITSPGTAPADPLFFMLHCNVDRLWAKWQWSRDGYRFKPNDNDSYPNQGIGDPSHGGEEGIGDCTKDTMWPWNGATGAPRPSTAAGGTFPQALVPKYPTEKPILEEVIDFQGQNSLDSKLGFAYDDIPFDLGEGPIV